MSHHALVKDSNDASTTNWFTNSIYVGSCEGQPIVTSDESIVYYYFTGNETYLSMKISRNSSTTTQTLYTDSNCENNPNTQTRPLNGCLSNEADDDGYLTDDEAGNFNAVTCTTGTPQPLSSPSIS